MVAVTIMSLLVPQEISARTVEKIDSIALAHRLKALRSKKDSIQREIKVQDAKRNREIAGVTAETMEEMNDKQDSLCLALRSELVDVTLEIKELSPKVAPTRLINSYNSLVNRRDTVAPASTTVQPVKPTKPTKPTIPVKKKPTKKEPAKKETATTTTTKK